MKVVTRPARRVRLVARGLVTLVSVGVLAASAFGWVSLRALDRSTPTADVISAPPASAPSAEQNFLLVGVDSRSDAEGNPLPAALLDALHAGDSEAGGDTADTLIVVHVPAGGGRATAISVPRDSYVDLPDGLGKHKINSAYARASHAVVEQLTDPAGAGSPSSGYSRPDAVRAADPNDPAVQRAASAAGARATIGAVETLTGLPITHYASVNLAGFADVSQAIGGVPVCLQAPVNDPYSGLRLPAGPQEVSGAQALAFVRQRHGLPNGDLDRITRQQVFLAGATDRLLSSGTLADPFAMRRLTGVVSRSVTLDDGWDILGFARQAEGLSAGAVTFRTIPTGTSVLPTPSDGEAVQVFPDRVRAFVADAVAQDDPSVAAPAATPPSLPSDAAVSRAAQTTVPSAPAAPVIPAPRAAPAPVPPPITAAAPGCIN